MRKYWRIVVNFPHTDFKIEDSATKTDLTTKDPKSIALDSCCKCHQISKRQHLSEKLGSVSNCGAAQAVGQLYRRHITFSCICKNTFEGTQLFLAFAKIPSKVITFLAFAIYLSKADNFFFHLQKFSWRQLPHITFSCFCRDITPSIS